MAESTSVSSIDTSVEALRERISKVAESVAQQKGIGGAGADAAFIGFVVDAINALIEVGGDVLDAVVDAADNVVDAVGDVADAAMDAAGDAANDALNDVTAGLVDIGGGIRIDMWITNVAELTAQMTELTVDAIGGTILDQATVVKGDAAAISSSVTQLVKARRSAILQANTRRRKQIRADVRTLRKSINDIVKQARKGSKPS